MAKTFTDFWNELKGDIAPMSPFKAQNCVQRAWRQIRDARRWSFLFGEAAIYTPALVNTGTVTLTQFSTSVVGDAAAGAAWAPLILHASGIDITKRQFRSGTYPVYNITAYDPATFTLTLDRPYMEPGGAGSGYSILRCYIEAPSVDFLRWESMVDPVNQYRFLQSNLHRFRAELDRRDPYRSTAGLPYILASYKTKSDGTPIYEMWPHPTAEVTYMVGYSRRGADLGSTDELVSAVSDELLMSAARCHAYVWAAANAVLHKELEGINWHYLLRQEREQYTLLLRDAKKQDEEAFIMNVSQSEQDFRLRGPLDANYLQNHDLAVV